MDFKTKEGLFEWLFMPLGLTNTPTIFMRYMDDLIRPFIGKCVIFYFDDILIFSRSWEEDVQQLRHSSTTSTIYEHGKMLICDDQHQIFGVCN